MRNSIVTWTPFDSTYNIYPKRDCIIFLSIMCLSDITYIYTINKMF